jgi:phospholipid/cholesterol/gamma-HCH transport system substrate-binding protein
MPRTRSLAWSELKIGLVSIFAIIVAAAVIFMVSGEGGFFWQRYSIKSVFADIQGLKVGAPVRVAGVEVGSVTDMTFVGDKVEVTMQVNTTQQARITDRSLASLGSVSLLARRPSISHRTARERPSRNGAMCGADPRRARSLRRRVRQPEASTRRIRCSRG